MVRIGDIMNTDLDIIIPCYNAKETLFYTLSSISIQRGVSGFKVYLVNDKSDYDYQEEIEFFSKFFPIEEIKLKTNQGPGAARREGIKNSNSKYIMFIDSDDSLYDCFAIKKLYYNGLGHDLCISNFILERDGVSVVKEHNLVWLHGKIYRREFLEKNNINFNDTRANEDNGFNRLILLLEPDYVYLDEVTYVYKENSNSITRSNNRSYKIHGLEGFIYNMKWAIDESLKRGANKKRIPRLVTSVLISMYYDYLYNINEKDAKDIIKYCKPIIDYYINNEKIDDGIFQSYIKFKEDDLKQEKKQYEKVITFDEFIEMVINYD